MADRADRADRADQVARLTSPLRLTLADEDHTAPERWRWQGFVDHDEDGRVWGLGLFHDGPGRWTLALRVGTWTLGIERVRRQSIVPRGTIAVGD